MMIADIYGLAANLLLLLHFLYVSFVVLGQASILLGCRRLALGAQSRFSPDVSGRHLRVAVLDLLNKPCLLTIWEYHLRESAGQTAEWEMTSSNG